MILTGTVIHGFGNGKRRGCPTANIGGCLSNIPPRGLYAGLAVLSGGRWPCTLVVGKKQIEAHLHGFDGDCYGEHIEVTIFSRIVK